MKFLLRNKLFWLFDRIKSSLIKKNYLDIKFHFYYGNTNESIELRNQYLNNLIKHSIESVPFYKLFNNFSKLEDFPVINKLNFIENYSDFMSSSFNKTDLYKTTTSGSTGTPFVIYKDKGKIIRHQAENIFFSEIANYRIGQKLYYTRVWNTGNAKSKIVLFFKNIEQVEIGNLSDSFLNNFLNKLQKDKNPKSILGFSSFFEALAIYLKKNKKIKNGNKVNSLITMSESLPDSARHVLMEYFGCPVISRYSNMENGFIAQQLQKKDNHYFINHGSFIIEILDINSDVPVSIGELGRIVITDLFNYAMPFIRYDTGDLGVLSYDTQFGNYFRVIEGRKTDFIYNTKGELLSPHSITNTMWNFNDIKQFQFIQKDVKDYLIKINNDGETYGRSEELINSIQEYIGYDAKVIIEYVNEIPTLNSGKRKKIICEINK